jgi:hypothetical protein
VGDLLKALEISSNTLDQHGEFAYRYTKVCGEHLGPQVGEDGVYVRNDRVDIEGRFARSIGVFQKSGRSLSLHGEEAITALLNHYEGFLQAGNCPEGSPAKNAELAKARATLVEYYRDLKEELRFEGAIHDVDNIVEVLSSSADDDYVSIEMGKSEEPRPPEHVQKIGGIQSALESKQIENDQLSVFETLLKVLKDPSRRQLGFNLLKLIDFDADGRPLLPPRFGVLVAALSSDHDPVFESLLTILENPNRRQLGFKLLKLIDFDAEQRPVLPPRFHELVAAAGDDVDPIFGPLVHVLRKPQGEDIFLALFRRLPPADGAIPDDNLEGLIYVAAIQQLNEVRRSIILRTLSLMDNPVNVKRAERMVDILRDPNEQQKMDSEPLEAYLRGLKQRKGSGGEGGGSSGAASGSSSTSPPPQSVDPSMSSKAQVVEAFEKVDDSVPQDQMSYRKPRVSSQRSAGILTSRLSQMQYVNRMAPAMWSTAAARNVQSGIGVFRPVQ